MLLVGTREQHSSVDLSPKVIFELLNRSEPKISPGPGLNKL